MPYADPNRRRAWQRARYHRTRNAAIAQLGGRCVVCRRTDDLEFDHRDPQEKRFNPTHVFSGMSEALRQAELAKCQLLCRDHHREKTKFVDNEEPSHWRTA